jgi:hypothetical protein
MSWGMLFIGVYLGVLGYNIFKDPKTKEILDKVEE